MLSRNTLKIRELFHIDLLFYESIKELAFHIHLVQFMLLNVANENKMRIACRWAIDA